MCENNCGRFLDKIKMPSETDINKRIGTDASKRLSSLDHFLTSNYEITRELKFPFGNEYGWGYKYSSKNKLLCYVFFEKNRFTVTITIGKGEVKKLESQLTNLLPKTNYLWQNRYPCGDGGWIHYPVESDDELKDILTLIHIKKKPTPQSVN